MPPAFAALFGSVGLAMYRPFTDARLADERMAAVHPSMKMVRLPWFSISKWNRAPPFPLSVAAVIRQGWYVVAVWYGWFKFVTQTAPALIWMYPIYCQS